MTPGILGIQGIRGIKSVNGAHGRVPRVLEFVIGGAMPEIAENAGAAQTDFLPLIGPDHVEFYAGNRRQAAYYYRAAFGMKLVAYAGPETGTRDRASFVLEQGKIRFVLTTPLLPDHPIAEHVKLHGDGVRDIALTVDDAELAYREATRRGGRGV